MSELTPEEERMRTFVATVVGRSGIRNFVAIIGAAFSCGVFLTKVKFDVNTAQSGLESLRQDTNERVKDWTAWRHSANGKIDQTRWQVENHELRITEAEKNVLSNTRDIGDLKARTPK